MGGCTVSSTCELASLDGEQRLDPGGRSEERQVGARTGAWRPADTSSPPPTARAGRVARWRWLPGLGGVAQWRRQGRTPPGEFAVAARATLLRATVPVRWPAAAPRCCLLSRAVRR